MGRSGWVRAALAVLLLVTAAPLASAQPALCVQPSAQGCPIALDQIVTASVASPGETHRWRLILLNPQGLRVVLSGPVAGYELSVAPAGGEPLGGTTGVAGQDAAVNVPEAAPGDYVITVQSPTNLAGPSGYQLLVQRTFTLAPTATLAPTPTETPIPTPTLTATPEPTETPPPTATAEPTEAPLPTATPEPTEAPTPDDPGATAAVAPADTTPTATATATVRPTATRTATPARAAQPFGPIRFGTEIVDRQLVGEATRFLAGITRLIGYAEHTREEPPTGTPFGDLWRRNGEIYLDNRGAYTWTEGIYDYFAFTLSLERNVPLRPGTYELVIYLDGREVQRASCVVE